MIFVTRYSFITAILLSNLFFLFFIGLSRSNRVLLRIPLRVFALLGAALLVKLLFPIEVESTIEISSFQIYPAIIAFLGKKLFTIGGFVVQVRWLLPRHRALNRVWLGLCLGLLEMMWFPALCAFALRWPLADMPCHL